MSDSLKGFLIKTGAGLGIGLAISLIMGFTGDGEGITWLRAFCDGYFLSAAVFLAWGGLVFTYNGGALDGLGYAAKIGIDRLKRNYEEEKISFLEYREKRENKAKPPRETLLAGLVLAVIAAILLAVYNHL